MNDVRGGFRKRQTNHLRLQGEMVDRIEYHVEQGRGNVAQAHQELVKAKEYQSKARKVLYTDTTSQEREEGN